MFSQCSVNDFTKFLYKWKQTIMNIKHNNKGIPFFIDLLNKSMGSLKLLTLWILGSVYTSERPSKG